MSFRVEFRLEKSPSNEDQPDGPEGTTSQVELSGPPSYIGFKPNEEQ